MPIRLSGLASGLDTEAIVGALVSAYSFKKEKYTKAQTKLAWKQDAWKTLNSKVYGLYTSIGSMRYSSNYSLKKTSVSDSTKATATASGTAIDGTHKLKINRLAQTAFITGGELDSKINGTSTLLQLGIKGGMSTEKASISIRTGTKATNIDLDSSMTINQFVNKLNEAGVSANYDEKNHRFYIGAKSSGVAGDFSISANSSQGMSALNKLGLLSDKEIENIQNSTDSSSLAKTLFEFTTAKNVYDLSETKALVAKIKDYKTNADATYTDDEKTEFDEIVTYINANKTKFGLEEDVDWENITDEDLDKLAENLHKAGTYDTTGTKSNIFSRTLNFTVGEGENIKGYNLENNLDGFKSLIKSLADGTADESDEKIAAFKQYLNKKYADEVYKVEQADGNYTAIKFGANGQLDWDALAADDDRLEELAKKVYSSSSYSMSNDPTYKEISTAVNAVRDGYLAIKSAEGMAHDTPEQDAIRYAKLRDAEAQLKAAREDPTNKKWIDYIEKNFGAPNSEYDKSYSDFWIQNDNIELANSVFYRVDLAANVAAGNIEIDDSNKAHKENGIDAEIELNGVKYTNGTNAITVNGLTVEALAVTENEITVNVSSDTEALYDKVKDFLNQYNSIITEMQKLYNADSAKDYEPLTDDEKAEMSESEIEKWEQKIKDSLLRRDNSLSGLISTLTMSMMKTYDINGKTYSWSTFAVHTLGTLNSEKYENYNYHIDGDSEDSKTSGNQDKLRAALAEDPEAVIEFLKKMSSGIYSELDKKMKSSTIKSVYTVYNDKEMASEYSNYNKLIKTWTDRVTDMEDSYYKKFSAMEKALATLQGNSSSISSLLGG